ncbi:YadA-like family protein [Paraburkholderia sp.]|uniref:YadA family autotransporter adhesin n=1 Tax=Paraburkholderia sp. TaxID=1926495 RepID=UPI002390CC40|nr:YadA-like family protein [Paraburkholderia sp.]MDE1179755.1 YadA-like family protein [Paraburkholderia sp.]
MRLVPLPAADYLAINTKGVRNGPATVDANAVDAMAIGLLAHAGGASSVTIGAQATSAAADDTVIGAGAWSNSERATAIGSLASIGYNSERGVAVGFAAHAGGADGVSLGALSAAEGASTVAVGGGALAGFSATGATALGFNARALESRSVALGDGSIGDRENAVSVGSSALKRQIINVAPGTSSGDAVNVTQLGGVTNALGGGAAVGADGMVTKPTYTIGGNTYNDVGAALAAAVTTSAADALSYDTKAHDSVALGKTGTPVQIRNVKAAALSETSTDAVNGAQLYATGQAVSQNASEIANLDQRAKSFDTRITSNGTQIGALDTRVSTAEGSLTDLGASVAKLSGGTSGVVRQDAASRDLYVGKDMYGAHVSFAGVGGARELLDVAAGTTERSAVNLGQVRPVVSALGGGAQIQDDGTIVAPAYHVQGGTQTTVGDALGSLDSGLTTLQRDIAAGGIGIVTQDATTRIINIGSATDGSSINIAGLSGNRVMTGVTAGAVNARSVDAVNGGQLYANAASIASALGGGATVQGDGTIGAPAYSVGGGVVNNVGSAIGNLDGRVTRNTDDIASLKGSVGLIGSAVANTVQYDSSAHDKVTLGTSTDANGQQTSGASVTLTNLKDGELSATSHDAVTGAQLWTTNQQIADLNQGVRNYQVNDSTFVGVNSGGAAAQASGQRSVALGGGAQALAANSVALGDGAIADQANTVSVGAQGSERRIVNVAPGSAPTDAVNMQQFQGGMRDVARNAYSGAASAMAMTMIPDLDANKNFGIGVGTAGYKGYQAVAVGVSGRITQSLKVRVGAGVSSAATSVGGGAMYQW